MCTNSPAFSGQPSSLYGLKTQVGKLERYLKGFGPVYLKNADKKDAVSLTGGEPALHPDFFRLLAYFRKRLPGADITLLTNGRRFADAAFARRFAAAARPPFSVAVPFHGGSPRAHDRVAGVKGAFREAVAGVENLLSAGGPAVEIRVVLHRLNVRDLGNILSFLLRRFRAGERCRVSLIHYELEGMSVENHGRLSLRLSESARALAAVAPLLRKFRELSLYHFPLCVVGAGLRPLCRVTLPPEDRIYPAICSGCSARRRCLGLMLEYYKTFGDGELRPLRRRIAARSAAAA
jgi:MoaA/NifB/PqqE/SkfB family radical SAM enzyme